MNCIVKLNDKLACKNCGNPANESDTKCSFCHVLFDEKAKAILVDKRQSYNPHRKTQEEITRLKLRNNEPLCLMDFISVEKMKQLKKVRIMI